MPKVRVASYVRNGRVVAAHNRNVPAAPVSDVNVDVTDMDPFGYMPDSDTRSGIPHVGPFINVHGNEFRQIVAAANVSFDRVQLGGTPRCDVWYESQSDRPSNLRCLPDGCATSKYVFTCRNTGREVGVLTVESTTDRLLGVTVPSAVEFGQVRYGAGDGTLEGLWGDVCDGPPPDDETALVAKVRDVAERRWGDEYRAYVDRLKSCPMVDYVFVNDEFRGKGFAKEMYGAVGRHLSEDGRELFSSWTQSEDAERMWGRFLNDGDVPTVLRPLTFPDGKVRHVPAISYLTT